MVRVLCQLIGVFFCIIGAILLLLPIPFGLFFLVLGLMFLIPTTPAAAKYVRAARKRFSPFDKAMTAVTRRAPTPFRRVLKMTEISACDW